MNVLETLKKVRETLESAGTVRYGDRQIAEVDLELLENLSDETIQAHWGIHAAAVAYYSQLKNRCFERLEASRNEQRQIMLKNRAYLLKVAKETYGLSRPSKEDLDHVAVLDGKLLDLLEKTKEVDLWEAALRDIEAWVNAWNQKSYAMRGYTDGIVVQKRSPGL